MSRDFTRLLKLDKMRILVDELRFTTCEKSSDYCLIRNGRVLTENPKQKSLPGRLLQKKSPPVNGREV